MIIKLNDNKMNLPLKVDMEVEEAVVGGSKVKPTNRKRTPPDSNPKLSPWQHKQGLLTIQAN
jgi:hypothetical protein